MSGNVFANGREISAKSSSNKSIAAMPGPCLSPPSPPAGPIPIPYPNFSKATDLKDESRDTKIKNKGIGLKNKSSYKSSKGNEAATRNFGMGVITHTIQGKTKFAAWSFDVKAEGQNVTRFMDLTTHNHMNQGDGVTASAGKAGVGIAPDPECVALDNRNENDKDNLPESQSSAGNTNTNYNFKSDTKGVPSESKTAHSIVAVHHSNPEQYVQGKPASDRRVANNPDRTSNVQCDEGKSFRYSGEYFKGGHSEARIIERIFSNSNGGSVNGTLTMKIDWQPSSGGQSCSPCEYCHALLCAAAKCGLEIVFCTKSNKKEKLDKDNDCEDNLDMTDSTARAAMRKKNRKLKKRLSR